MHGRDAYEADAHHETVRPGCRCVIGPRATGPSRNLDNPMNSLRDPASAHDLVGSGSGTSYSSRTTNEAQRFDDRYGFQDFTRCNVAISAFVHIVANERVSIGDNSIIASAVQITTSTHNYRTRPYRSKRVDAPVTIGRNVWIGAGAIILPRVTLGDDCVVGAGSIVTRDVAPATVVAGNPARVIRTL